MSPYPWLEEPELSASWRQLLHEWSQPALVAHAGWLDHLPPLLLNKALASATDRSTLNLALRSRVPLPPFWHLADCDRVPWALGAPPQLLDTVKHAGWLMLRSGIAQVVTRQQVQNVLGCVGRGRYQQALSGVPTLWLNAPPADAADLAAVAEQSPAALDAALHTTGWRAINNALAGPLVAMRARIHLVMGPQACSPALQQAWPIQAQALIDALNEARPQDPPA
jgi:hypothetical protein